MTRIAEETKKCKPCKTGEVSAEAVKKLAAESLGDAHYEKNKKKPSAKRTEERSPLLDCLKKKETEEKKLVSVTLNEVAHSIFYAPMYVAIEEGYFEDEGIELTLVTGFGARPSGRNALQKINKLDRRVFIQVDLLDRGSPEGSAVLWRQRSI